MNKNKEAKTIPLPPEAVEILKSQKEVFIKKFGRPPNGNDPVFFDPASDTPVPMSEQKLEDEMLVAMDTAGVRPDLIWIWLKTGLIATEDNLRLMSREDRRALRSASREFEKRHPNLQPYIDAARARLAIGNGAEGNRRPAN
jgi:hypothetical protein